MTNHPTAASTSSGSYRPAWQWWLALAIVVVVAAGLRLWMPGPTVLTVDELTWSERSRTFHDAIASGDFAAARAAESGTEATRPGVTTMWIGALGIELNDALGSGSLGEGSLHRSKQLVGVVCSLWLIPFIVVARRLVGRRAALVAGGLLAVSPLLVGHSAVLHTDALLTMSAGTAVLALLAAFESLRSDEQDGAADHWRERDSTRWIVVAGAAGGFAFLTKVTALVVLGPAVALTVAAHLTIRRRRCADRATSDPSDLRPLAAVLGIGTAVFVVVVVAFWPALWVTPASVIRATFESTKLASAESPRLFLGEVDSGGDKRYYVVETYFRLSAWLFVAAIAAAVWKVSRLVRQRPRILPRRLTVVLVGVSAVYWTAITLSDKQYARYLLPLLPILVVAVAVVADHGLKWVDQCVATAGLSLAFLASAVWTQSLAPYQISHVNPLVGGQKAAENAIPLGWGEGKEVIGETYHPPVPCPSYSSGTTWFYFSWLQCRPQPFDWLQGSGEPPDFVYRYVHDRQNGAEPARLQAYLDEHGELDHSVTIYGVHYVEVWRLVPSDAATEP